MTGVLRLHRGRWTLMLWPPFMLTFERTDEDPDGWRWIGFAWTWALPRKWRFPKDPAASGTAGWLVTGWRCGPIDLRRLELRVAGRLLDEPLRSAEVRLVGISVDLSTDDTDREQAEVGACLLDVASEGILRRSTAGEPVANDGYIDLGVLSGDVV